MGSSKLVWVLAGAGGLGVLAWIVFSADTPQPPIPGVRMAYRPPGSNVEYTVDDRFGRKVPRTYSFEIFRRDETDAAKACTIVWINGEGPPLTLPKGWKGMDRETSARQLAYEESLHAVREKLETFLKRDARDPAVIDAEILMDAEATRDVPVEDVERLRRILKELGLRHVKMSPTKG